MCVNSCAVLVPLKSSEKGATSRISSKRAGCGGRLMGLVPYLPWSKHGCSPWSSQHREWDSCENGCIYIYIYIKYLIILCVYIYIWTSICEGMTICFMGTMFWPWHMLRQKLQFLVISPVIAVLMSRPMFKTYMAVCQNPCSTPSVHIKIAGIYGCEWMWITP